MKKIIAASILFTLFIGCVSKQVETLTTNYDNAGNILNERSENVKIKGFLATSKTAGLAGKMAFTNQWSTNESGVMLTNMTATLFTLGIESTSFDVSTNAADTIKAAGKAIKDATPGPPSL